MTPSTRRCWGMAKNDKLFHQEMEKAGDSKIPSWYSSDIDKIAYAAVYYGWLIGKEKYTGETKQYLTELDGQ